jgi:hypothetical protein
MESFKTILESQGIYLNTSIYRNLELLSKSRDSKTHVAFLLDQYNTLINYKSNVYFKTDNFPYTQHAEIATIVNYYTKKCSKSNKSTSKTLLVIQLRPNSFGTSRPCTGCVRFILNNWDNLHLKRVVYSNPGSTFTYLCKYDLQTGDFAPSSATVYSHESSIDKYLLS